MNNDLCIKEKRHKDDEFHLSLGGYFFLKSVHKEETFRKEWLTRAFKDVVALKEEII